MTPTTTIAQTQPYFASVERAVAALARAGQPLAAADAEALARLSAQNDATSVAEAERLLETYTLLAVELRADGYGSAVVGGAEHILIEQGWKLFLVRVSNPTGLQGRLDVFVGAAAFSVLNRGSTAQQPGLPDTLAMEELVRKSWLRAQIQGLPRLSGAEVEYLPMEVFCRDGGERRARFGFSTGDASKPMFPKAYQAWVKFGVELQFDCRRSSDVVLRVRDTDGQGCVAALTVRDTASHVYPPQPMRAAPDMAFHAQVYRGDGETMRLPDGDYVVESWRGPEYVRSRQTVRICEASPRIEVNLQRWIDPSKWGWYSGDTHIHAAGCSHFMLPSRGVAPETMIRHVRGEALSIGQVLTWGPAWYHQKQFFTGGAISPSATLEHPELQEANNTGLRSAVTDKDGESLLRYDVEVSGFPSSLGGHLILLRLQDQDYPLARAIEDWPSWNLPILRWAKTQNAIVGYAHSGAGMATSSNVVPNYEIPPFNSTGANEAIVDVTHGAVDFLGGCELEPACELNAWYHLLNCGFRCVFAGETDYPCISDDRPGVGRSYVRLDERPLDDAGYQLWVEGLKSGRLYSGDGRSHVLDFRVNGAAPGGADIRLSQPDLLKITALVCARLEQAPTPETEAILNAPPWDFPSWHIERARVGQSRQVNVELVVNGQAVAMVALEADGAPRELAFSAFIDQSSWVALRILASVHTHPVFVTVADQPVRASRRSAQWLRACVDQLWAEKHRLMRLEERDEAAAAYDHARRTYVAIAEQSYDDRND